MRRSEAITAQARLLRQVPLAAEALLWRHLRGRAWHGMKFRRAEPVAGHIAAFACREARLILDLRSDGPRTANDLSRVQAFRAAGWQVICLTEAETLANPQAALDRIPTGAP